VCVQLTRYGTGTCGELVVEYGEGVSCARRLASRVGPLALRVGSLASRAGPLAPRAGPLAPRAGPLAPRAGPLAPRAWLLTFQGTRLSAPY
jgi:hypothetical protein